LRIWIDYGETVDWRSTSARAEKGKGNVMQLRTFTCALGALLALGGSAFAQAKNQIDFSFNMVPSAAPCGTPKGFVTITHDLGPTPQTGLVENMHVVATGLPANTDFDLFVIQVPKPAEPEP
jgi:hypothetical protein